MCAPRNVPPVEDVQIPRQGELRLRPPRGVFERPKGSGVWWINYYDQGRRRHREKVGRYEVALEAYYRRKREIREAQFVPPTDRCACVRFQELARAALAAKQGRNAETSVKADTWRAAKLIAQFGPTPAARVDSAAIETFLQSLLATGGRGGPTVNRYRSLLSSIFAYGLRTGQLRANPVAKVPRFRESDPRVRFLEPEEETVLRAEIRKSCPQREPELDLALHTGLRRNEQFALRWEEVHLERRQLTIYGKGRGGMRRRFLRLNSAAARALIRLHAASNGHAFVIPEARARGQRDWRRWFEDAVRNAGIENFRWHDLRHTFASRLVMAGVDLRTVQSLMGHRSILQTMKYAHLTQEHELAAVERLCPKAPPRRAPARFASSCEGKKHAAAAGTKMAPPRVARTETLLQLAAGHRVAGD